MTTTEILKTFVRNMGNGFHFKEVEGEDYYSAELWKGVTLLAKQEAKSRDEVKEATKDYCRATLILPVMYRFK